MEGGGVATIALAPYIPVALLGGLFISSTTT
jgi:hypothetical protein